MRRLKPVRRKPRAEQRRKAPPPWRGPAISVLTVLVVVGCAAAGGYWSLQSGFAGRTASQTKDLVLEASRRAGLAVTDVLVENREQVDPTAVLEAIGVQRGDPILAFDPVAAKARLERLGWVAEAEVFRLLPSTIYVRLLERRPIAIWQHDGTFSLVDPTGMVIGAHGLDRYRHLKVVVGSDAPAHAPQLLAILATQPALMERVVAAVRVGERRWNLRLDNGTDVKLPEEDPAVAWERLARLDRDHAVLDREVSSIDLRLPDRTVVRVLEKEHPDQGRPGNKT